MKKALSVFMAVTVICVSLCSCLGIKLPSGSSSVKGDSPGTLSDSYMSSGDPSSDVDTSSNDGDLSSGRRIRQRIGRYFIGNLHHACGHIVIGEGAAHRKVAPQFRKMVLC